MNRFDELRSVIGRAKHQINDSLSNVPIANKESSETANEFIAKARDDIASSKDNYRQRRYSNAAENLQQSVEKSAKSLGLLFGNLQPTTECLKSVGHDSFKAFIIDFWSFFPRFINSSADTFETISQMDLLNNNSLGRKLTGVLERKSESMRSSIARVDSVNSEIEELRNLDESAMWEASLQLDESNKWIGTSLSHIRRPAQIGKDLASLVGTAQKLFKIVGVFDEDMIRKMKLSSSLGAGSEKLFQLSLITCWHLEPARYPPVGRYWRADAYNSGVPFVREMSVFINRTSVAVENISKACNLTSQILEEKDE